MKFKFINANNSRKANVIKRFWFFLLLTLLPLSSSAILFFTMSFILFIPSSPNIPAHSLPTSSPLLSLSLPSFVLLLFSLFSFISTHSLLHFVILAAPPVILKELKSVRLMEGSDLTFESKITGTPIPKITWYKDDREIIPGG